MDFKKIFLAILISSLLIGSVCAANSVSDFKVNGSYKNDYSGSYCSVYLNGNRDSGVTIYKYVDDDLYDDELDAYDGLIHEDAFEYLSPDDDFTLNKNADNTAKFTDIDHSQHGLVEVVKDGSDKYVVVFWAKDSSSVKDSDLSSTLTKFNEDNSVKATAF